MNLYLWGKVPIALLWGDGYGWKLLAKKPVSNFALGGSFIVWGCGCQCRPLDAAGIGKGTCGGGAGSGIPKCWHSPSLFLLNVKRGGLLVTTTAAGFPLALALLYLKQKSPLLLSCSGETATKRPSQGFPVSQW